MDIDITKTTIKLNSFILEYRDPFMSESKPFSAPFASHPFIRIGLPITLMIVSLVGMYGPTWLHYVQYANSPYRFNSDFVSFVTNALRMIDPDLFPGSYDVDYIKWASPIGYQKIYALGVQWMDPVLFGKVLGAVLFFVGVFAMGLASFCLSGWAGAWVSMALVLSLGPELSGMPRNFSMPLLTLAVAALLYGRVVWLAPLILVSAMFYPPVAVIIGALLFLLLFVWPKWDRGDAIEWSFKRRAVFLAITAILCLVVEGKQWLGSQQYGPLLTAKYCHDYPESQGRLGEASPCQPLPPLMETLKKLSVLSFSDQARGEPWVYSLRVLAKWQLASMGFKRDEVLTSALVLFILLGFGLHLVHVPSGRRLLIVLVAGGLGYFIAQPFAPQFYYPLRYLEKTVPLFLLIALPASAAGLATVFGSRRGTIWFGSPLSRQIFVLLVGCSCLLLLGGRGKPYGGIDKDRTAVAPLMDYLRTLPKNVMIAGWPKGMIESVPLLAYRPVLVSNEMHWTLHKNYTDEMRSRTYALIDAYFATTPSPLIRLHKDFGVTHMILEKGVLDCNKLRYFAPFIEYANQKRDAGRDKGFELLRQIPYAQVFSLEDDYLEDIVVLDLKRLIIK
ncbi:MAG: hypothetical protein H7829_09585 [Magnetococcus sp. THC-1_WYH]